MLELDPPRDMSDPDPRPGAPDLRPEAPELHPVAAGGEPGDVFRRPGEVEPASEQRSCALEGSPAAPAVAGKKDARERSGLIEALVLVLVALVLALSLKTYVAEAYEIKGKSMEETFHNGQRVVVLKSFYEIHRGDIIVFASSEEPGKDLIKRVVGLPGETVKIARGQIYINGVKIEENYRVVHDSRELRDLPRDEVVPRDHYYVLGDNRPDSHDSRFFGSIPAQSIKGKVVVRWWPFNEVRTF